VKFWLTIKLLSVLIDDLVGSLYDVFEACVAYWVVADYFSVVDYVEGSEGAW
jgi:hypothetical protein